MVLHVLAPVVRRAQESRFPELAEIDRTANVTRRDEIRVDLDRR